MTECRGIAGENAMTHYCRLGLAVLLAAAIVLPAGAVPWPYQPFDQPHDVGNNYGEFQNYGSGSYYHDGIDLVTPAGGVATYSVASGTVTHITVNDPLYSGIIVGTPVPGGIGWLYWHLSSTTFQYDVGDEVPQGGLLGLTAEWPVASFHHTHFNRVMGTGGYPWTWYESIDNPLLTLIPHSDPDPPVFETTYSGKVFGFAQQSNGAMLDPSNLGGSVDIIARIKDVVGMPEWPVAPFHVEYWIQGATQSVPLTNSVMFSRHIPPDATISTIYREQSPLVTQGNYDQRVYYIIVTNTDGDGTVEATDGASCWVTSSYAPGDYWVYVRAADVGGNVVSDSMYCTIAGAIDPQILLPETSHDFGPVPADSTTCWNLMVQNVGADPLSVRSVVSSDPAFTVARTHFFVAPGGTEVVDVCFTPALSQLYEASLTLTCNDAATPSVVVQLSGTLADPSAVAATDAGDSRFGLGGLRTLGGGEMEIVYTLERSQPARLELFDVQGRQIHEIALRPEAGRHAWRWGGADAAGRPAPSGTYFVRLSDGRRTDTASGVLLR